ncbi:universal stress protein [Shimia sp. CNT1-13L.2]|uniref:universal stress protein n=1 Tax=Shimia sp. CNT1-13L.2 TaxID=2959663 RepID=UPI0020CBBFD6|nr:universal stress protein [Shimia sp. CNT1-13L.2]MCP9482863.1 universal stress protein [Shimia sp. CNT1-13L.2]
MAYKSILSVLTDTTFVQSTLAQGIELARGQEAHLDALCLGVDRSQTGYYYAGANAMILQETLNRAQKESKDLEEQAIEHLRAAGIRWGTESGVAQIADLGRHVAARARFADLVVLPKPYGKDHGAELEPTIEAAMFEGQAPVLVIPDNTPPMATPKRISIGWNESAEALVAVRAALPFLQKADAVRVVVIDPPTHGPHRSDPGGLLSQFLSRHGVRVEIDVLSKTLPRVSDVLLRHAKDTECEMVVMGAYGHSRFREAILGGATRNMLEQADIPVFMAH